VVLNFSWTASVTNWRRGIPRSAATDLARRNKKSGISKVVFTLPYYHIYGTNLRQCEDDNNICLRNSRFPASRRKRSRFAMYRKAWRFCGFRLGNPAGAGHVLRLEPGGVDMHILRSMILVLLFLGASISDEELARRGKIREDAPVKASLEITIHAPTEKVWLLLTDVRGWPKWQTDISTAEMTGPLQVGTTFSWTTGGTHIKSRVALVQPCTQFAWTGSAFGATAIHLWKLSRLADDQTIVKTDESMHGFLLTLFYSSRKLEETDQRWLDRLKLAAESGGSAGSHLERGD